MRARLTLALAACLIGTRAQAQAIEGVVKDSSGNRLASVEVRLDSAEAWLRTDSSGFFRLAAPAGRHEVLFRRIGFKPQLWRATVTGRDTLVLDVALARGDAQELTTVEVKASRPRGLGLEGFEERRQLKLGGRFLDSLVLRKADGRRLSDVLREYGVCMLVSRSPQHEQYAMAPSRCHPIVGEQMCPMTVILDKVTIYRSGSRTVPPPDFSRDFYIPSYAAIEVYTRPSETPMEFQGRFDCGVIVLWTRRG